MLDHSYQLGAELKDGRPIVHIDVIKELMPMDPHVLFKLYKELKEADAQIIFDNDPDYPLLLSYEPESKNRMKVSFDAVRRLEDENSDLAEFFRQSASQIVIDSAGPEQQERLQRVLFGINAIVAGSPNHMMSCMKIADKMHDSFNDMRLGLNVLSGVQNDAPFEYVSAEAERAFLKFGQQAPEIEDKQAGVVVDLFKNDKGQWTP